MTVIVLGFVPSVFAFTSTGKENFAAGVMTDGFPAKIRIRHTPMVNGSPVTKKVIILGEAGDEPPLILPPYGSRRTTFSSPPADPKVRVQLFYRYVPSLDPAVTVGISTSVLPAILGPDPTAFAFEVPRSSVNAGFLQYRIVAEQIQLVPGGGVHVVDRNTFPKETSDTPQPFVTLGVQANASQVFGPDGGRLTLPDGNPIDGESALDIPSRVFSGRTSVALDEIPLAGFGAALSLANPIIPPGLSNPINVYRLDSDAPFRGSVQISLLYPDFEYPNGQDGLIDGAGTPEGNIAILWYDGFVWRRLGGNVNPNGNLITTRVGSLGFFAIAAAPPLSPEDRRPLEKVITPNGDGINDAIIFTFGDLSDNVQVEIFDITGRRIKTVYSLSNLQWDGRDDNGQIVESGVYIYQYEVDGKRVSGVVAVAK